MGVPDAEVEIGRPIAAALAPGARWREMFEALREGGPWKSDGGGRRAEEGDSGFGFAFREGEVGEVWEALRSRRSSAGQPGPESGEYAMLVRSE
jgi:hypothetical protein